MQVLARAESTVQHKWFKEATAEKKEKNNNNKGDVRVAGHWNRLPTEVTGSVCTLGHLQSSGQIDLADPA